MASRNGYVRFSIFSIMAYFLVQGSPILMESRIETGNNQMGAERPT